VPRRRGLRPRLLAAVVRSNVTSAFAAERQVVSQTGFEMSDDNLRFAVLAEKDGDSGALVLHSLTMEKLYEHIVVPYEEDRPFFIDGVPVERRNLRRAVRTSC
jgi:hypothetical protein